MRLKKTLNKIEPIVPVLTDVKFLIILFSFWSQFLLPLFINMYERKVGRAQFLKYNSNIGSGMEKGRGWG